MAWGLLAGAIPFGFSDFLIGIHRFQQPLPAESPYRQRRLPVHLPTGGEFIDR